MKYTTLAAGLPLAGQPRPPVWWCDASDKSPSAVNRPSEDDRLEKTSFWFDLYRRGGEEGGEAYGTASQWRHPTKTKDAVAWINRAARNRMLHWSQSKCYHNNRSRSMHLFYWCARRSDDLSATSSPEIYDEIETRVFLEDKVGQLCTVLRSLITEFMA